MTVEHPEDRYEQKHLMTMCYVVKRVYYAL